MTRGQVFVDQEFLKYLFRNAILSTGLFLLLSDIFRLYIELKQTMAAVTTTLTLPHIAVRPNAPYSRRREPKPQPAINDLRGYLEHTYLSTIRRYDMNHSYSLPPRGDRSTRPGVTIRADPKRKIRHIRKYDKHSFDKVVKKCECVSPSPVSMFLITFLCRAQETDLRC